MIRVFDFKCDDGHVFERFVPSDTTKAICPECGKVGLKQLAAPRCQLEGITGAFPGAYHAWERKRAEKQAQEVKRKSSHGE